MIDRAKLKQELKVWYRGKKRDYRIRQRDRRIYHSVPYDCYCCELLGICRDESNGWKCSSGCMCKGEEE